MNSDQIQIVNTQAEPSLNEVSINRPKSNHVLACCLVAIMLYTSQTGNSGIAPLNYSKLKMGLADSKGQPLPDNGEFFGSIISAERYHEMYLANPDNSFTWSVSIQSEYGHILNFPNAEFPYLEKGQKVRVKHWNHNGKLGAEFALVTEEPPINNSTLFNEAQVTRDTGLSLKDLTTPKGW